MLGLEKCLKEDKELESGRGIDLGTNFLKMGFVISMCTVGAMTHDVCMYIFNDSLPIANENMFVFISGSSADAR